MARELIIGNQVTSDEPDFNNSLCVSLTPFYELVDLHYPRLGQSVAREGHAWEVGLKIHDRYHPFHGPDFQREIGYFRRSLVTRVKLTLPREELSIASRDCVSYQRTIFLRQMEIENQNPRESLPIHLFFRQCPEFKTSGEPASFFFDPEERLFRVYSPQYHLTIAASLGDEFGFHDYGLYSAEEGADRCREDFTTGRMNGRNQLLSAQGTSGFTLNFVIPPSQKQKVGYFLFFASSEWENHRNYHSLKKFDIGVRFKRTHYYWVDWSHLYRKKISRVLPKNLVHLYERSLLTLRVHTDNHGAILSGLDGDCRRAPGVGYHYAFPFDGAIMARAYQMAGYREISFAYLKFCHGILHPHGFSPFSHRYNANGHPIPHIPPHSNPTPIPSEPQAPYSYHLGAVLWCLWEHFRFFKDVQHHLRKLFFELVLPGAHWLSTLVSEEGLIPPSLDIKRNHLAVTAYSMAAVHAGLSACAAFCRLFHFLDLAEKYEAKAQLLKTGLERHFWHPDFNRFLRQREVVAGHLQTPINNSCLKMDSAVFFLFFFNMYSPDDPKLESTLAILFDVLKIKTPIGGFACAEEEEANPALFTGISHPHLIPTLWYCYYRIRKARLLSDLDELTPHFEWLSKRAMKSGILGDRFDPYTGISNHLSPAPLSHAWLIITLLAYCQKLRKLSA